MPPAQFLNAMVDLSARPGDAATRQVVLARAGEVADRFAAAGAQLDTLQQEVRENLQGQRRRRSTSWPAASPS